MSDADRAPEIRTGWLWAVLAVLLLVGTVASAFVVWGVTDLAGTGRVLVDVPVMAVAAFVAVVSFLLLVGVLYRVDRLRGDARRRVVLFD